MYFPIKMQCLQFTLDFKKVWQVWRSIPWSGIPWLEVHSSPCSGLQEGVTLLRHQCCRRKSRHEAEQAAQCCTSLSLVKPGRHNLNSMAELFRRSRNRTWLLFPGFYILMAAATVKYDKLLFVHISWPSIVPVCWASPGRSPPHLSNLECALAPCHCRASTTWAEMRHPST